MDAFPDSKGVTTFSGPPSPNSIWMEYFRLTRLHWFPVGSTVVVFPALWGLTMAAYSHDLDPQSLLVYTMFFVLGGTLLHSAGCVINDIVDVDFDRQVERCKDRPLAAGTVSMTGAWILLWALTLPLLGMLWMTNQLACLWGLVGIIPLPWLYPFMKRWTWWPQAWLGVALNWGFTTAWIVIVGQPNWKVLGPGCLGGFFWTLVYDTIYACQDRSDDKRAGVKSTALLFGSWVRPILGVFAAMFVGAILVAGYMNGQDIYFHVVTLGGALSFFGWTFVTWNPDDPVNCGEKFMANGNFGYIIWGALLLDYYAKRSGAPLFM